MDCQKRYNQEQSGDSWLKETIASPSFFTEISDIPPLEIMKNHDSSARPKVSCSFARTPNSESNIYIGRSTPKADPPIVSTRATCSSPNPLYAFEAIQSNNNQKQIKIHSSKSQPGLHVIATLIIIHFSSETRDIWKFVLCSGHRFTVPNRRRLCYSLMFLRSAAQHSTSDYPLPR
jgi:hypothetical protein